MEEVCLLEAPMLNKGYVFVKRIGQGAQAVVDHMCHRKSHVDFAIKTYTMNIMDPESEANTISVLNEIEFLRDLKHCKNIVQLHRVFFERDATCLKFSLVMDLAKHGSLLCKMNRIKRKFSEDEARTIMI